MAKLYDLHHAAIGKTKVLKRLNLFALAPLRNIEFLDAVQDYVDMRQNLKTKDIFGDGNATPEEA